MPYRVRSGALCLLRTEHIVLLVRCQCIRAQAVGSQLVDIGDETLVKEELADVRNSAAGQGTVGKLGCILVDNHML